MDVELFRFFHWTKENGGNGGRKRGEKGEMVFGLNGRGASKKGGMYTRNDFQLGNLKVNCFLLKLNRKLRKNFQSPRRESNAQPSVLSETL